MVSRPCDLPSRMAPIPECIKADWGVGSRASLASLDSGEEETSEEGEASQAQSQEGDTSNIVPPDQLKKTKQVGAAVHEPR